MAAKGPDHSRILPDAIRRLERAAISFETPPLQNPARLDSVAPGSSSERQGDQRRPMATGHRGQRIDNVRQ